ncbi:MAG TPA: phosphotransferase [Actinomycetes bacterium]|nr:phosphotransferase [Actinomycetes bacterium]
MSMLDERLELALSPRRAGPALAAALGLAPDRPPRIVDAKCDSDHGCTVVYQLGDRLVVATSDDTAAPALDGAGWVEALGLRARVFPDDPALPALPAVLDPERLAGLLVRTLDGGVRVLRCRATPMRYRPGRRCTLRIDAWLRAPGGPAERRTWFGKVYHDAEKAAAVWRGMELVAAAEPVRAGRLRVAGAAAFLPEVPMILQDPVAGVRLDGLIGPLGGPSTRPAPRAAPGVRTAASALAALHGARLDLGGERPATRELHKLARRAAAGVSVLDPDLGDRVQAVAAGLAAEADRLPRVVAPGHGDCKPAQFLVGRGPAALLDFDHCGMADPAADVGSFTASLRQLAIRRAAHSRRPAAAPDSRATWLAALAAAFVDEYERCGGAGPELRRRVLWFERLALLRKALRAFARSPSSPLAPALAEAAARPPGSEEVGW